MGAQVNIEINPGWLELPLTGTNFHGPSMFEPMKPYYSITIYSAKNPDNIQLSTFIDADMKCHRTVNISYF